MVRDQHRWQGIEGEARFLHSEKPIHNREISLGRKGRLWGQREMQQVVCGRQDK